MVFLWYTMKVVKQVVRVGNTGGVLVPREWVNGRAEVRLLEEPLEVERDILEIIRPFLQDVRGIYLVGSYARDEQTARSDVDVLVITGRTTRKIIKGKYQIILISQENLEEHLKENALPLLPMILEAKPLVNAELIESYKRTELTKRNLSWYLETTKSALRVIKTAFTLSRGVGESVSDDIAYSIILRLRGVTHIDCIKTGRAWTKKEFLALVRKLSGSLEVYEAYLRSKDGARNRRVVALEAATRILNYIEGRITEQEKWVERRG